MLKPFMIYDLKNKEKYCAYGDYRRHINSLVFLSGWRAALEKATLYLSYYTGFAQKALSAERTKQWSFLKDTFRNPIQSALLLWTGWYKDNIFSGFVTVLETDFFVKFYADTNDASLSQYQAGFVQEHFQGPFVTVPVLYTTLYAAVSPCIKRKRSVDQSDYIEQKLLTIIEKQLLKGGFHIKRPRDFIPMDMLLLAEKSSYGAVIQQAFEWMETNIHPVTCLPVHGDMVPWNMFVDNNERIVLVDYERSGWHVPYYDYFHYMIHTHLDNIGQSPFTTIMHHIDLSRADVRLCFVLYLMDQVYRYMDDIHNKDMRYKRLNDMLQKKMSLITEVINHKNE